MTIRIDPYLAEWLQTPRKNQAVARNGTKGTRTVNKSTATCWLVSSEVLKNKSKTTFE